MFAESSPTAKGEVALISRPGLVSSYVRGDGPISAVMWKAGVFDGDPFFVSGNELYRASDLLGEINGDGPVSYAFSDIELVLTRGESAWSYDGTDLEEIAFPDDANVTAVAFIAGLFVYARAETAKFYWSAVLDGRTIDALDFATAESSPDPLLDVQTVGGNLLLPGSATTETWFPNGALDLPFTRVDQRLYARGVRATGCTAELDNTLFLIGDDGIVYRLGDVPERISDHGIEERIGASSAVSAFTFDYQGHKFFCVRLDNGTWAIDAATAQWCEFASFGRDNWRARSAITTGTSVLLGDDADGRVWTLTDEPTDDGGILESMWTAGFHIDGGTAIIDNLQVEANVGRIGDVEGEAVVEMRASRDAGATFGTWRQASLGLQGRYRTRARWTRLGMFDQPGALFEFRITDPAPRRVSGVFVNERGGGRSR